MQEMMARDNDLLPPLILSTTWPSVPAPPSLTLAAFPTRGYVRDSTHLVYVNQPTAPVTLSGADGTFWLAIHRDLSTPVSLWSRQPGTHYLWQRSGARPGDPPGGLLFAEVTVAGGVITVVTPTLPVPPVVPWIQTTGTFGVQAVGFALPLPVGTVRWVRIGTVVTLWFPQLSGTSTSTSMGIEGLPAVLQPTVGQSHFWARLANNGAEASGFLSVQVGGTIAVAPSPGLLFTPSGTKTLYELSVTYNIA